jgi:hypothetical protein
MKRTALLYIKLCLYIFIFVGLVFGVFIYSQSETSKLKNEASANGGGGSTLLALEESLDVDFAPPYKDDFSGYHRSIDYRGALATNSYQPRLQYLDKTGDGGTNATTDLMKFSPPIALGANLNTIKKNNGVTGVNWWAGNPNFYRTALQESKHLVFGQYTQNPPQSQYQLNLAQNNHGVKGYFYVSENQSENCAQYGNPQWSKAQRRNFKTKDIDAASPYLTLSPGGGTNPPSTDNLPIYVRFGRGKIQNMFSANGNVVAIIESRVFYDNVCTFEAETRGNTCGPDEQAGNEEQFLKNLSFPVSAVLFYNGSTKAWSTVKVVNSSYKSAFIPVGANRTDLLMWGFGGTAGVNVSIYNPTGIIACDGANFNTDSYDREFGGDQTAQVEFTGIENILGGGTNTVTRNVEIRGGPNPGGTDPGRVISARDAFDQIQPIFTGSQLYVTIHSPSDPIYPVNLSRSYLLKLASVTDLLAFPVAQHPVSPGAQYVERRFDAEDNFLCVQTGARYANMTTGFDGCIRQQASTLIGIPLGATPLLPINSGYYLNFQASGSLSKFFACTPTCAELTNAQVFKNPAHGNINANFLVGSYKDASMNTIAVGDNVTGNNRLIYIGNQNSVPSLESVAASCSTIRGNPFALNFAITTKSNGGAIARNVAYLAPLNSSFTMQPAQQTDTTNDIIVVSSDAGEVPANSPSFDIISSNFPAGNTNPKTWNFTLRFNQPFSFEKIYQAGGFDFYVYIQDNLGLNTLVKADANITNVDPYESCTSPFFSTSNGDFRSRETKLNANAGTKLSNRFWQTSSANATVPNAGGVLSTANGVKDNPVNFEDQTPSISDFRFEHYTSSDACDSRISFSNANDTDFCQLISESPRYDTGAKVSQKVLVNKLMDSLSNNLSEEERLDITTITNYSPPLFNGGGTPGIYPNTSLYSLTLSSLTSNAQVQAQTGVTDKATVPLFVVLANAVKDVMIIDDVSNANNPNTIIVWCPAASCVVRIVSVGAASNMGLTNANGTKYTYTKPSLTNLEKKSRLYINYNPADTTSSSNPNYNATGANSRKVILRDDTAIASTENQYYLGGIITDGYVYNNASASTSIVKGLVLARGIVARSTAEKNKDLYFKDFYEESNGLSAMKPFLFIDYDPRFLVVYRSLIARSPSDVSRTYVGL